MQQTCTLIVGASASGLASAASLQKKGIEYIVIEKEAQAASPWRNHYERLHLHTNKAMSNLPYKKFDKAISRYPSRQQVVNYFDDYQKELNINPVFNTEAKSIRREGDFWITETNNEIYKSDYVIIATGAFGNQERSSLVEWKRFQEKSCTVMVIDRQGFQGAESAGCGIW